MSLFDILKKKKIKEVQPKKEEKKIEKKEKPQEKKEKLKEQKPAKKRALSESKDAYHILRSPHITEKATDLTKQNQYIFRVDSQTNKIEVKKAIESVYGVEVVNVKIINVSSKQRRLGRITGRTKGYKKAIVKVREGQKIEVLPR